MIKITVITAASAACARAVSGGLLEAPAHECRLEPSGSAARALSSPAARKEIDR
jgi:hypothetical protein